jgi:hypothetical protein
MPHSNVKINITNTCKTLKEEYETNIKFFMYFTKRLLTKIYSVKAQCNSVI